MNQILNFYDDFSMSHSNKKNISIIYKIVFFTSMFFLIVLLIYYFYIQYNYGKDELLAEKIVDNFNISSLYSQNSNYEAINTSYSDSTKSEFSVIGIIEIPEIGINYPIISTISEEYLKISPCRFYGPLPNEIGNLCIAGHNYNNYKGFSRLKKLKLNDTINIYSLSGEKTIYHVYKKYEVNSDDFSCTNQNTNGKRELTLITCNNIKSKRTVIKAKV